MVRSNKKLEDIHRRVQLVPVIGRSRHEQFLFYFILFSDFIGILFYFLLFLFLLDNEEARDTAVT